LELFHGIIAVLRFSFLMLSASKNFGIDSVSSNCYIIFSSRVVARDRGGIPGRSAMALLLWPAML
jgi:hypothetical protein